MTVIQHSSSLPLNYRVTKKQITEFLEVAPDEAQISVTRISPDRLDESDSYTLVVNWSTIS